MPAIDKQSSTENGEYLILTSTLKFQVGKQASKHGLTLALHYFSKTSPDIPLKETIIRRLNNLYHENMKKPHNDCSNDVKELTANKAGRPCFLAMAWTSK